VTDAHVRHAGFAGLAGRFAIVGFDVGARSDRPAFAGSPHARPLRGHSVSRSVHSESAEIVRKQHVALRPMATPALRLTPRRGFIGPLSDMDYLRVHGLMPPTIAVTRAPGARQSWG